MPKAAVLTSPKTIIFQNQDSPEPEQNEVKIAVEYAGICGTDLALYSGDYSVSLPLVCGHEFVGIVKKVGAEVDPVWEGKRVTAEINNSCKAYCSKFFCEACKRSMPEHCLKRTVTGIINKDGAFSEEIIVPEGVLHEIPENISPLTATLTEPLAAALQTFEMTPIKKGETLVVLGPGRLGILITFVASLMGAKVIAVSRSESKRNRALNYGASIACSPEEAKEVILKNTDSLGADIVVESTGHPEGISKALNYVRPKGTLSLKTTCGLPEKSLNTTQIVVDEIQIQGSRCGPFEKSLKIISSHQDKLKQLISNVEPLENIIPAMNQAFRENKVILKVH